METRAMAIAFFYAVGTGLGGIIGPILFGKFIEEGRDQVVFGYYLGAGLMIAAGLVAAFLAVNAEKRSLEDIAEPLTAQEAEQGSADGTKDGAREIDLRDREKVSAGGGGDDWDGDDIDANRRAGTSSSLRRYH